MTSYVSSALRRDVERRALGACEYCLIHQDDTFFGCEVDHIIAEKHGGATTFENLAYAGAVCNRSKGTDIASLLPNTTTPIRLYNPRTDHWNDNFQFVPNTFLIEPLTDIGHVTCNLLGLNTFERILERQSLILIGRFPPPRARR
jgi:HNH endonuclease